MESIAIVVSGLPASGKSTLAIKIAERLGCVCLDKDDFLEALFDDAVGSHPRSTLSRQSDQHFQQAAQRESRVVLVSHWRAPTMNSTSGTISDWVALQYASVIEIYCRCSARTAAQRFSARVRHPAHRDNEKSDEQLERWMHALSGNFPLGIGQLITVDTEVDIDVAALSSTIKKLTIG